jgi:hypothetical protein
MEVSLKFQALQEILEHEGPLDVRRAESLINDLKPELLSCQSLLPQDGVPPEDRLKFRSLLEFDALISIRTRKLEALDRAMAQLKCYYFGDLSLPASDHMPLLLAIHLVRILGSKKLVDFNIELQLTRDLMGPNPYLDYVADLHQSVMDHSFSRLFQLKGEPPSPLFETFIADLLNGARDNHADSIHLAYAALSLEDLRAILYFASIDEVRQFVTKRGWEISDEGDDIVRFDTQPEAKSRATADMLARSVDLSIQISLLA